MKLMMRIFNISRTAALMCAVIGVLFMLLLAVGVSIAVWVWPFEAPAAYAMGLLLGCLLSGIKVILLEKSLERSADMGENMARGYAGLMAAMRYILTVAALLPVFFFREIFGLAGAILGILSLQAAAYVTGTIIKKSSFKV